MQKANMKFVQELCAEHNKIRKNPQCYIDKLQKVYDLIRKNNILHLFPERPFKMIEGKEAVSEAIYYLNEIPKKLQTRLSKSPLIVSEELCKVSFEHAKDLGSNGLVSHIGKNNSHLDERVEKYCNWTGGLTESLDFGTVTPENILLKLLICDGDKERKQREYIFEPGFRFFGAANYIHIKYRKCTVISYAVYIQSKDVILSEKNNILNYIYINKNFNNKNKLLIEEYLKKAKDYNEENKIETSPEHDNKNENIIFDFEDTKNNRMFSNTFIEEKSEEYLDTLNKKANSEWGSENSEKNKIKIESIKKKEMFGLKISETKYKIKDGIYHIVEKEEDII